MVAKKRRYFYATNNKRSSIAIGLDVIANIFAVIDSIPILVCTKTLRIGYFGVITDVFSDIGSIPILLHCFYYAVCTAADIYGAVLLVFDKSRVIGVIVRYHNGIILIFEYGLF